LPLPALIRLGITNTRSGVSRFVDLIARVDRDIVPADVPIDRIVALVLIGRIAPVIVVVAA
jgi:hypothetical protein